MKSCFFSPKTPRHTRCWIGRHVGATNSIPSTLTAGSLTNALAAPDLSGAAGSMGRMMGALALVFALLIGALWIYRHWQRLLLHKTPVTGLRVVDVKNLGQRMAVYVVAYRHQQFLIGASPNGLSLLSVLDSDPTLPNGHPLSGPGSQAAGVEAEGSFRSVLEKTLSPKA